MQEAAILTSLPDGTIREAIHKGELPAIRRGLRLRIDHSDLSAWAKARVAAGVTS